MSLQISSNSVLGQMFPLRTAAIIAEWHLEEGRR
jgi:hypothetical protein